MTAFNDSIRVALEGNPLAWVSGGVTMPQLSSNAKTGHAFGMRAGVACVAKTARCVEECYGKEGSFTFPGTINSDNRNYGLTRQLMATEEGRQEFVAHFVKLLKRLARIAAKKGKVAKFRLHSVGDFLSPNYLACWLEIAEQCPEVAIWCYTRTFTVQRMLPALAEFAALANVALWLSADADNYKQAVTAKAQYSAFAGIAIMQGEPEVAAGVYQAAKLVTDSIVVFPVHHGAKHTGYAPDQRLVCPAVVNGKWKTKMADMGVPACTACNYCIPTKRVCHA